MTQTEKQSHVDCSTNESLRQLYQEQGFLRMPKLLDDMSFNALEREFLDLTNKTLQSTFTFMQDPELVRCFSENPEMQTAVYDNVQQMRSVKHLSKNSLIIDIVKLLIENVGCLGKRPLRIDVPFATNEFAHWHQDHYYVKGNTDIVTVWVPLQSTPWRMGCISIMPGSHKLGVVEHSFKIGKKSIPLGIYDREVRFAEVERGGCSVH